MARKDTLLPGSAVTSASTDKIRPELWEKELKSLTRAMKKVHGSDWSWTSGGCFAFADAFQKSFGGELVGVASLDDQSGDYPIEHALVKLEGGYYDFNGVFDPALIEKTQKILSKEDPLAFWFEDEFLSDAQFGKLRSTLRCVALNSKLDTKPVQDDAPENGDTESPRG